MRLFLSAGEPSGDLHGASLIRSLRVRLPGVQLDGFGGGRMAEAGCRLLYPLCELALMGFLPVLASLPRFRSLLRQADAFFAEHRPDALVLVDYPGFHWWLARTARRHGIPVVYFVPPQLWAWAGWRARKMRRLVDVVLCNLPFEEAWYHARGIPARYIGHPYFDELLRHRLDGEFLSAQRARPGAIIGLLPGSRDQELRHNLPSLLHAAGVIHGRRPDVRFLVACLRPEHAGLVRRHLAGCRLPIEVHAGRTPEVIQLSHSCLSVSGSVSLELLFRGKPAAILYRARPAAVVLAHLLKRCKYITLVNLLAERELFPEYFGWRCVAEELAAHVLHWLHDRPAYEALVGELAALRRRVAEPGACDRAAEAVIELVEGKKRSAA